MSNVPTDPHIFHITHVDNLAGILREGGLWCDAQRIARQFDNTNIGHRHIKQRRMSRPVMASVGGTLGDYVPFNFCPRSVMLYAVHRGHQDYDGGQESVVHLVSSMRIAEGIGRPWAFTDRHAELAHALHFDDPSHLKELRWDVMDQMYWTDVKEERQAEFLVHQFFPWTAVIEIGVMNSTVEQRVHSMIAAVPHQPMIRTTPSWYY